MADWDHPHFEKIMPFQAENLRLFALTSILRHEPDWLKPAEEIHRYLRDFLTSPEGAFYASQDADLIDGEHGGAYFALDDARRRRRGIPRVDQHLYARENGLAITGLCALYAAGGDAGCLAEARRAADWALAHRALPEGGFRHDEADAAGPYLGDSLAMPGLSSRSTPSRRSGLGWTARKRPQNSSPPISPAGLDLLQPGRLPPAS